MIDSGPLLCVYCETDSDRFAIIKTDTKAMNCPRWLLHGCAPFQGGDSVAVDSLFIFALMFCGKFMLGLCFVMVILVSFLVLQSSC